MSILGLPELDATQPPTMVSSQGETVGTAAAGALFVDVLFETNPLDGECDTRIHLSVQPLETTFHAVCVKHFRVICLMIQYANIDNGWSENQDVYIDYRIIVTVIII